MITIERYRNAGKDQERTHIVMVMPASFQCNAHDSLRVDVSFTTSTQGRLETQVACCRKLCHMLPSWSHKDISLHLQSVLDRFAAENLKKQLQSQISPIHKKIWLLFQPS